MPDFRECFWGGTWIIPLGMFVILLLAVLLLCRRGASGMCCPPMMHGHDMKTERETPLDILEKRYARGEITKDQFEQMKKDIRE